MVRMAGFIIVDIAENPQALLRPAGTCLGPAGQGSGRVPTSAGLRPVSGQGCKSSGMEPLHAFGA